MKVSAISLRSNQAFGVDLGINIKSQMNKARFDSYRLGDDRVKKTSARQANIEKMHDGYVMTMYSGNDYNKNENYYYRINPKGYPKDLGMVIMTLPADTAALVAQARLERALKKFKPEDYQL